MTKVTGELIGGQSPDEILTGMNNMISAIKEYMKHKDVGVQAEPPRDVGVQAEPPQNVGVQAEPPQTVGVQTDELRRTGVQTDPVEKNAEVNLLKDEAEVNTLTTKTELFYRRTVDESKWKATKARDIILDTAKAKEKDIIEMAWELTHLKAANKLKIALEKYTSQQAKVV